MTQNLEKLIERRKEQAAKKNLFSKAELVSVYLGQSNYATTTHFPDPRIYDDTVCNRLYDSDGLRIRYHKTRERGGDFHGMESSSVTVEYREKEVFSGFGHGAGGISSYVPGVWEKKLDNLYAAAKKLDSKSKGEQRADERKRKQKAIQEEKKKWGL